MDAPADYKEASPATSTPAGLEDGQQNSAFKESFHVAFAVTKDEVRAAASRARLPPAAPHVPRQHHCRGARPADLRASLCPAGCVCGAGRQVLLLRHVPVRRG